MDGAASDLRPGLPWQMVEIHEPVRLLFVIETDAESMQRIIDENEAIAQLVRRRLGATGRARCRNQPNQALRATASLSITRRESRRVADGRFLDSDWYRGQRDHLGFASINANAGNSSTLTRMRADA